MDSYKVVELLKKYCNCPKCGNDLVGGAQGNLRIEEEYFYRDCKCGWAVKVDESGQAIPFEKDKLKEDSFRESIVENEKKLEFRHVDLDEMNELEFLDYLNLIDILLKSESE